VSSPNSVSHEISSILLGEILRGQYRVGERLPSERDLSSRFDISRGAIREALSQLEQQGIIETQPGGVRVKPIEEATLAILGPMLALQEIPDPDLVDQFLEIFSVLTRITVTSAVKNASADQLIQLQTMLVELRQDAENFEAMRPRWESMLDYLAAINTNMVARLISNDVKAQFVEQIIKLKIKPNLCAGAGPEFVKTLQAAFRQKDGELAATAFEKHFYQLRLAVRDALENMQTVYQKQAV
jgi:GntR family transcriptional repressor for pyruvate dehydrogenase complex